METEIKVPIMNHNDINSLILMLMIKAIAGAVLSLLILKAPEKCKKKAKKTFL